MSYSTADKEFFDGRPRPTVFQYMARATLSQVNPVSGTQYTVLATTRNVRILRIVVKVTWTVQPNPLEIHFNTIDGESVTASFTNPVNDTWYEVAYDGRNTSFGLISFGGVLTYSHLDLDARSVTITAETTGGTVSNLSAAVIYEVVP